MIKQRFLDAGLDERIWKSQFGFRKKRNTEDAIYIARRHIELACAQRQGKVSLLALDWRKAFDSIDVERALDALRRYGITSKYMTLIGEIIRNRQFYVQDFGIKSQLRSQRSGISQGCTLSPLLFVTVMSAIMENAVAQLSDAAAEAYRRNQLADIAYADDTLLLGTSAEHVEEFLHCVARAGQSYGLELHPQKLQLLQVNCEEPIRLDDENTIRPCTSIGYLGSTLSSNGRMASELNRRIGMAKADFRSVRQVWTHSTLSQRRKLDIFAALIESKLLYALSTGCFTKSELRRLDGFQARCLRTVLKIPAAYVSRISNQADIKKAGFQSASVKLKRKQLPLLGKVIRCPNEAPQYCVSFSTNSVQPLTYQQVRRVGRPRKEWIPSLLPEACHIAGSTAHLKTVCSNETYWKRLVRTSTLLSG